MVTETRKQQPITLVESETQSLLQWAEDIETSGELTVYEKGKALATRLGATYRPDGLTEIGFWAPELEADMIQPRNIYLEVFTPLQPINPQTPTQTIQFKREQVHLPKQGEYFWGVLSGMKPGTKEELGSFYWLCYLCMNDNEVKTIGDVLAHSLPFGVYAPAELYDMNRVQDNRADLAYFGRGDTDENGIVRVHPPRNILQLHVNTASQEGSLKGLTRLYQRIGEKLQKQDPLTPLEESYIGYDAVQLLPIEPIVEYRGDHEMGHGFFIFNQDDWYEMDPETETLEYETGTANITLKKPDTQNWGYDIVIFASSATNPAVLETLRPDELVEFIATLHNFPTGPIQVIYDIVYGHADNQALELLNGRFLKGPNMYGQDVNHQNPTVRAILLEMQRRKNNTGADGIRVDGAQDFKFFNPISGRVEYDDAYLNEMGDVLQTVGNYQRRLFSIFEDGRPWPAQGWEELSTYRDIVEFRPESFQWGPLIFAHNTPSVRNFWDRKWRRVCEVMEMGANWITGCGNHDTLRRGTQVDLGLPINWNLGNTLPEVLQNAYDNPAITMLVYGFSPGLPMDFINCTTRSPWGFIRNTDDRYGVKVVAEEAGGFLDWQVLPQVYDHDANIFPRLKKMGFGQQEELRQFVRGLYEAIEETDYDLEEVANLCQRHLGEEAYQDHVKAEAGQRKSAAKLQQLNVPGKSQVLATLDVQGLKAFAKAFMEDAHDLCHVSDDHLMPEQTAYNLALRNFRHAHPWLRQNLSGRDRFNRISDDNHTIFYGLRTDPVPEEDNKTPTQVAMAVNMGGEPMTVPLGDWLQLDLNHWEVAIASPGVSVENLQNFKLADSQGVLLMPKAT